MGRIVGLTFPEAEPKAKKNKAPSKEKKETPPEDGEKKE